MAEPHANDGNDLGRTRKVARGTGRGIGFLFRLFSRLFLVLLFIGVGLLVGGFLKFSDGVTSTEQLEAARVPAADAVVVLTGGSARIAEGLDLIAAGKGKRLLISGVNEDTSVAALKAINTNHAPLFDCCVDVERAALDTIGNARETAKWVADKGYSSLIVVTSSYHMPRSLLEFRRTMPKLNIKPHAVILEPLAREGWWKNPETLRFLVVEYVKYVGAAMREYLKPQTISALRGSMLGG
ncbi:YdcF family protein [Ahrensia sp. R2A130]|uniref:YdcF family protein n=1 Tax=Ahrensia sp. R2A130 TaxID=744979 RepID=UPI0018DE3C94|nr:YdcF family protein [Ahrensia sp. R2A130]